MARSVIEVRTSLTSMFERYLDEQRCVNTRGKSTVEAACVEERFGICNADPGEYVKYLNRPDVEPLFTRGRLRQQELVAVQRDTQLLGVLGIEGVFRVDVDGEAAGLLGLRHD